MTNSIPNPTHSRVHKTRTKESIWIEGEAESAFYDTMLARLEDEAFTPDEFFDAIYHPSNPVLEPASKGEGVVVRRGTHQMPLMRVCADLLARKEVAYNERRVREDEPTGYVLSVSEAAKRLGITPRAVRIACEKGTLLAIRNKKGTRWLLNAASVATYREEHKLRGPQAQREEVKESCTLHVRTGHKTGARMYFKSDGERVKTSQRLDDASGWEGTVDGWTTAAIETSKGQSRFFLLAPKSGADESFEFEGFFVRGAFEIVEKVNNSKKARERMAGFHKEEA